MKTEEIEKILIESYGY